MLIRRRQKITICNLKTLYLSYFSKRSSLHSTLKSEEPSSPDFPVPKYQPTRRYVSEYWHIHWIRSQNLRSYLQFLFRIRKSMHNSPCVVPISL
jgi:hypothetical protein